MVPYDFILKTIRKIVFVTFLLIFITHIKVIAQLKFDFSGAESVISYFNNKTKSNEQKIINHPGYQHILHHKVFIIDNATVILGSYNPTAAANTKNDENIIITHDETIAQRFVEEFERLRWE